MVLVIFTVLICAKYSTLLIITNFYILRKRIYNFLLNLIHIFLDLSIVTLLIFQERQHYLQDMCLKRCMMDRSQFGGRNKEIHIFSCVSVEAELEHWVPNICDRKAIAVVAEVKYMFDSFSTICQSHLQTLAQ